MTLPPTDFFDVQTAIADRFFLDRALGRGGMGIVWTALLPTATNASLSVVLRRHRRPLAVRYLAIPLNSSVTRQENPGTTVPPSSMSVSFSNRRDALLATTITVRRLGSTTQTSGVPLTR